MRPAEVQIGRILARNRISLQRARVERYERPH